MKLNPTFDERCGTTAGYNAHQNRGEAFCESCQNAKKVYDRSIYEANKEKKAVQAKAWKIANAEYDKEIKRNWYFANLEKNKAKSRKWYLENQELVKQQSAEWVKQNPERNREIKRQVSHRRRVRKQNGISEFYTEIQVLELYGTDCHICNEPIDLNAPRTIKKEGWKLGLHIDHLIPISKGGNDTLENVRPSHGICNVKKGAKIDKGNQGISTKVSD